MTRHPASDPDFDRGVLVALLDATRAVSGTLEAADACRLVAEHAARLVDAEAASLILHDAARGELVLRTVVDPAAGGRITGLRFPAERGIAGQVLQTGRAVRLDEARDNQRFYPGVDKAAGLRTHSLLAVPVVHADETLGVLEAINARSGAFSERDQQVLAVLANLVAGSARAIMRVEALEKRTRGLAAARPVAEFIGRAPAFVAARDLCEKVAPTDATVLLTGETGTGKEVAARAIHALSSRADGPFVAVNCAALPESLIESELFGHEAGAFTGATKERVGRFELAAAGTIMLDEVGEMPIDLQAKLLRVLENRECTRVGGTEPVPIDVRVIAATNRDLKAAAGAGTFREDLYYRLSVFPIALPALRERAEDLPLLVEHLAARTGDAKPFSGAALAQLAAYAWPGNVRELRNVVERALILADDAVEPRHLPADMGRGAAPAVGGSALEQQEVTLVLEALERTGWNQSAAARDLGISRDILRHRIRRHGLRPPPAG